ncbi:hypothetical protein [Massilia sp. 9I]|uniref:hypothetical protein n=1 Tax=Massilia sp. 9I TaxID=2653152 RepID=UPI0012EF8F0B|nr:hypothetical protein [Massilia sp. 9I]VXB72627.1 hypothetical protein MASSI9I_50145 [Massilia sp. 9I]
MRVICPKCSHVRPLDASNPDWQCPSCLVCYAKVNGREPVPARPAHKAQIALRPGRQLGWLILAIPLLAFGWGANSYLERRGTAEEVSAATEHEDMVPGVAALDAALHASGVDATLLEELAGRLEKSCARNKFGLSESACIERLREREDVCATATAQRFPGEIGQTSRLQKITVAYVGCIFEQG